MSAKIDLASFGDAGDKSRFLDDFARLPDQVRKDPFRQGILTPDLWKGFVTLPLVRSREFWVASDGVRSLGRVGASVSVANPDLGYIGFFEVDLACAEASRVALELLARSCSWLKAQGVKTVCGPVNYNTWFPYRFRTDRAPESFAWEPNNPPEYVDFFKAAAFEVREVYHSNGLLCGPGGLAAYAEQKKSAYEKALAKGYAFRQLDPTKIFEQEVPRLYEISMAGFKDNFLFEPIPYEAFRQLYVPIANKMDLSLAYFACDPQGKEIGFFFCFPDGEYIILKSVAMLPEARGLGLSNALTYLAVKNAADKGLTKMVTALVKAGAQSESYAKAATEIWAHHYALFSKEL